MIRTISRGELKQKIDRKDDFLLVETLPATAYHHNHLPGAINLPPDGATTLAGQLLPDQGAEIRLLRQSYLKRFRERRP